MGGDSPVRRRQRGGSGSTGAASFPEQVVSASKCVPSQVQMLQGYLNRWKAECSLSRTGLTAFLSLLLANAPVLADSPSEQALRARADQLYSALQQGNWRGVEKYLTKDSKRIFRSQSKKAIAGYHIDSVKIEADGQSAEVVVRLPGPPAMIAGPPIFIPESTRWRLVGRRWYMVLPDPRAEHGPPGPGDQQQASGPHFSTNSADLKFASTWASVGFVHQGEVKVARFPFTNVSQHTVTVADVQSTCPCLKTTSQQKEFKPGEAGAIELTFDPSSFGFKNKLALTLTVSVQTEPEHALTQLTVAASLIPGPGQAQHP